MKDSISKAYPVMEKTGFDDLLTAIDSSLPIGHKRNGDRQGYGEPALKQQQRSASQNNLAQSKERSTLHGYRVYVFDSKEHIVEVLEVWAISDLAAIVRAGDPVPGRRRELWNQGRHVLELPG